VSSSALKSKNRTIIVSRVHLAPPSVVIHSRDRPAPPTHSRKPGQIVGRQICVQIRERGTPELGGGAPPPANLKDHLASGMAERMSGPLWAVSFIAPLATGECAARTWPSQNCLRKRGDCRWHDNCSSTSSECLDVKLRERIIGQPELAVIGPAVKHLRHRLLGRAASTWTKRGQTLQLLLTDTSEAMLL
jgi:hypothetical protein